MEESGFRGRLIAIRLPFDYLSSLKKFRVAPDVEDYAVQVHAGGQERSLEGRMADEAGAADHDGHGLSFVRDRFRVLLPRGSSHQAGSYRSAWLVLKCAGQPGDKYRNPSRPSWITGV